MILVTQGVEYQMGIGWHWINVCCEIMSISKKTNVYKKKKVALYIYIFLRYNCSTWFFNM